MLFAHRLQVLGNSSNSVRIIQKGASEMKKDNESVVFHCISRPESTPYPQAYRCEQGHTLCMIRGGRHEYLSQWPTWPV